MQNNPRTPDAPIPPSTLSQAGTLAVATSTAWDSKAGMAAWWVTAEQVSKSTPEGDFLPVGKFMIRGRKNHLLPAVLLFGFGVLFQITEESKANHLKHRVADDLPTSGVLNEDSRPVHDGLGQGEDKNHGIEEHSEEEEEGPNHSDDEDSQLQPNPLQIDSDPLPTDIGDDEDDKAVGKVQSFSTEIMESLESKNVQDAEVSDSDDQSIVPPTTGTQTPLGQKGFGPKPRGKRAKAKKIATKYKDQDEEDRLAAQVLIGATAGQEKAKAEAAAKAAREAEAAFQKERRRAQHQRTQQEMAEHEKTRDRMLQEGAAEEEEERKSLALDSLVGTPFKGDEILEAIPICAPFTAMGNYKYKIKLQPGPQKKGKAVKEILARWGLDFNAKGKIDERSEDPERMWPREVELLRSWKAEEVTNIIPVGGVRVMMASGTAGAAKGSGKGGNPGKGNRGGKGSKKR